MEVNRRVGRQRDGLGKFPGSLDQARPPSKLIATITREDGGCSSQMGRRSEVLRGITPSECRGVFRVKKLRRSKKVRWKGAKKAGIFNRR